MKIKDRRLRKAFTRAVNESQALAEQIGRYRAAVSAVAVQLRRVRDEGSGLSGDDWHAIYHALLQESPGHGALQKLVGDLDVAAD